MRDNDFPLAAEYSSEDREIIAAVLSGSDSPGAPTKGKFLNRQVPKAPTGMNDNHALHLFLWDVRSKDERSDYNGPTMERSAAPSET